MSEVGFLPDFFARGLSLSLAPPFDGLMIAQEIRLVIKPVVEVFSWLIGGALTGRGHSSLVSNRSLCFTYEASKYQKCQAAFFDLHQLPGMRDAVCGGGNVPFRNDLLSLQPVVSISSGWSCSCDRSGNS